MKVTEDKIMYIACVYMIDTKSKGTGVLRYKNSRTYDENDIYKAHRDGNGLVEEVYNRIMSGEITFPAIKKFNKDNVIMLKRADESAIILYKYNESEHEFLCEYKVEKLEFYRWFNREIIEYCFCNDLKHIFCRYGAFWYLIGNVGNICEPPIIVKKFWWFTKLDKMIYYLFNKFETLAI